MSRAAPASTLEGRGQHHGRCGSRPATQPNGMPTASVATTTSSRVFPGQRGFFRFLPRRMAPCAVSRRRRVEVEPDDPVVRGERALGQRRRPRAIHSSRRDRRSCPRPSCRPGVRIDPRASRDQANQHRPQADPVRHPSPVTAQRVVIGGAGSRDSSSPKTASNTSGSSARMMVKTSTGSSGLDRTRHHSWAITATGGWSFAGPCLRLNLSLLRLLPLQA